MSRIKVLLVDDEREFRASAAQTLSQFAFKLRPSSFCRETDLLHVLCGPPEPRRGVRATAGGFSLRMERLEGKALEGRRTVMFGSVRRPSGAHFSILRFTSGCRPGLLSTHPFGALPA